MTLATHAAVGAAIAQLMPKHHSIHAKKFFDNNLPIAFLIKTITILVIAFMARLSS